MLGSFSSVWVDYREQPWGLGHWMGVTLRRGVGKLSQVFLVRGKDRPRETHLQISLSLSFSFSLSIFSFSLSSFLSQVLILSIERGHNLLDLKAFACIFSSV